MAAPRIRRVFSTMEMETVRDDFITQERTAELMKMRRMDQE